MKWPINKSITIFIVKVGVVFALWYLVYELWLLPKGIIDDWLSQNIVRVSGGVLQALGFKAFVMDRVVGIGWQAGIEIVNGCNGIAAIGLFWGFVIAYPGKWADRIAFMIFGMGIIYLVNVFRIIVLVLTQKYWNQFFDITHDYSTTTIFYLVIFLLWVIWANYQDTPGKKQNAT